MARLEAVATNPDSPEHQNGVHEKQRRGQGRGHPHAAHVNGRQVRPETRTVPVRDDGKGPDQPRPFVDETDDHRIIGSAVDTNIAGKAPLTEVYGLLRFERVDSQKAIGRANVEVKPIADRALVEDRRTVTGPSQRGRRNGDQRQEHDEDLALHERNYNRLARASHRACAPAAGRHLVAPGVFWRIFAAEVDQPVSKVVRPLPSWTSPATIGQNRSGRLLDQRPVTDRRPAETSPRLQGCFIMRYVEFTLGLIVCCQLVVSAAGQEPGDEPADGHWEEAVAILEKVNDAAKAARVVSYRGSYHATGWLANRVAVVEGTALIGEITLDNRRFRGFERFLFDVRVREPGSEEIQHFTSGHDGRMFYLIDWQTNTVHAHAERAVLGSDGRTAQSIGMLEFVHPTPFDDEIVADELELRGTAVVGDQECHVIAVVYAFGRGEATWYFSKSDLLPRRVDRIYRRDGEMATTVLEVTGLVIRPVLETEELSLKVPEGFEQTDVFAMDRQAALRPPPLLRY